MNLNDYDRIVERVQQGQVVAIAPAVDAEGNLHLVALAGWPTPLNLHWLQRANMADRALFALRAIHQARNHYGIA